MSQELTLYSYWRSSSSWRVRLALHHKGVDFTTVPVHLVRDGGEQHKDAHVARNPLRQIPTLEVQGEEGKRAYISQSVAIMEWLEDAYPDAPSIFPSADPLQKALTRQLTEIINSGTQPLQNLNVIQYLRDDLGVDAKAFCRRYIQKGLEAYLATLPDVSSPFSMGEHVSMADFCLVPQLYNARRFKLDLEPFARLLAIESACQELEAFKKAHPDAQPDFDANAPA